ncbi:pyruvate, water dikinase [Actinoplanes sp. LDG1-06]|uniref:Pyruvate, water dikinase n=1 Tax=Paractinoplanes ovalisporus TaxID=2810368 RepID=A0ABS2AJQ2_9ACTN|nr:PEP/pyruvate-binding domain-containing protein [Actinoplanes ovalisporus]MBM2620067.1 pyruvate, water dikinase [Actinoplanes ovalisporus]
MTVTTEASEFSRDEILNAYAGMGGGVVAVRSSATVEDAPGASYAGMFDTVLDVCGADELIAAIERCQASVSNARAAVYRGGTGRVADVGRGEGELPSGARTPGMAVVVQRMVAAETAGVLFTANPVTGNRAEMLVESAAGGGSVVVDGAAGVERRLVGADEPLREVGERLQRLFGVPQDVEWALDKNGDLWILQSRPITTLFPAPPSPTGGPRVYLEFGHVQGMLQPVTPMGTDTLKDLVRAMLAPLGLRVEITDIGGRLYGDLTDLVRDPVARKRLVPLMAVDFGPRAQAVMRHVLDDPRFAPRKKRAKKTREKSGKARGEGSGKARGEGSGKARGEESGKGRAEKSGEESGKARATRSGEESDRKPGTSGRPPIGRAIRGVLGALVAPDRARSRLEQEIERTRRASEDDGRDLATDERLQLVRDHDQTGGADAIIWPIVAGMLASALPPKLLGDVARPEEIHAVLGGMPHNVTIEMDLALWRLARGATGADDVDLSGFLTAYGHRAAAEVDLGVPRWSEDPAPVRAALANLIRVTDPEQAPDVRFARAAERAEATLRELGARARRRRPVRGTLAVFLLGRARRLAGLREAGKFAGLYRLAEMRRHLLAVGADLVAAGVLDQPGDIMFLTLEEATAATEAATTRPEAATTRPEAATTRPEAATTRPEAATTRPEAATTRPEAATTATQAAATATAVREMVAERRAWHERESRRRNVPVALLSDGTDIEAVLPAPAHEGALKGVGASAGRATGPVRVVTDPATAHIEPGEVLVTSTTDPGWTPLFLTAAALVTETGAVMAHGPTVAREYGIPAVICVPGATRHLRTGQIVTVDAAAGTVTVQEES